jgi:hypothetical protein
VLKEVRWGEDLGVLGEVPDLVARPADAAARREHPPVGKQQGRRVVLARDGLRRERCPLAGRRIPAFGVVDAAVHVDERRARGIAAGCENRAVGQQRQVVLAAAKRHRRGGAHLRRCPVRVDHARVVGRATAARDERLADVEDRVAAVAAVDGVALAVGLPRAAAGRVELPKRRIRARVEDAAVGRHVHPRIERQVERGGAERTERSVRPPHLRHVRTAFRDEHLAVREGGDRRVPAPRGHVGSEAPSVGHWIEEMRLDDPVQLLILVAAGDEQRAVCEVGEAGAEDVVSRVDVDRGLRARGRVVHRGPGEGLIGKRLRGAVADRVPGEHLPVGQQSDVDPHNRPVHDRTPLAGLSRVGRDCRRRRARQHGRAMSRGLVQVRLDRGVVQDVVLCPVTGGCAHVVRQSGARRHQRQRQQEQQRGSKPRRVAHMGSTPDAGGSFRRP